MVKLMFFGFRKEGLTREEALAEWAGDVHSSIVAKAPGLRRWVRNHPVSEASDGAPDWIGELWFDDQEAFNTCMNSKEMAAAFEDAKRFADLDKTYSLVVDEQTGMG